MERQRVRIDPMAVLRPHLYGDVPLTAAAESAGVPIRTARRWLSNYREHGPDGLARKTRSDRGTRRGLRPEISALIAEMADTGGVPITEISARVRELCGRRGWRAPSYSTVRSIVTEHTRPQAPRGGPAPGPAPRGSWWVIDHADLDLVVRRTDGGLAWTTITAVVDAGSGSAAGFSIGLGHPRPMDAALALHRGLVAAARTGSPPETLVHNHPLDAVGADLPRVCAALGIRLAARGSAPAGAAHASAALLRSVHDFLAPLRGGSARGPRDLLELPMRGEVEARARHHLAERAARAPVTAPSPGRAGTARVPLATIAPLLPRLDAPVPVHRDGVRINGRRYFHPALPPLQGRRLHVRLDPADLTAVQLFDGPRWVCRAAVAGPMRGGVRA